MSYLQYAKKDVNKVRFVKYPSKYQNENKIIDISTIPRYRSVILYYNIAKGQIMLFVSGKEAWKQIFNFQVYQIKDGMKMRTYAGLKNPFQRYRRNLN